jgi:hypothetical protein
MREHTQKLLEKSFDVLEAAEVQVLCFFTSKSCAGDGEGAIRVGDPFLKSKFRQVEDLPY